MTGYSQVKLKDFMEEYGENKAKKLLSDFSCPNADVCDFIKSKAIEFNKHGWAITHLIFASYKKSAVLVGYFTLAPKSFQVSRDVKVSKTLKKRILNFAQYSTEMKKYVVGTPLIAQLGKNYYNERDKMITGSELLHMACNEVRSIQSSLGGKLVYLECEDIPRLVEFYESNGFYNFGRRILEGDEIGTSSSKYLIQMLKYLK